MLFPSQNAKNFKYAKAMRRHLNSGFRVATSDAKPNISHLAIALESEVFCIVFAKLRTSHIAIAFAMRGEWENAKRKVSHTVLLRVF